MLHPITSSRSDPVQHVPQLVTSIPSAATCQGPGCRGRMELFLRFWCLDVEDSWIVRFGGGSSLTLEIRLSQSKDEAYEEPYS